MTADRGALRIRDGVAALATVALPTRGHAQRGLAARDGSSRGGGRLAEACSGVGSVFVHAAVRAAVTRHRGQRAAGIDDEVKLARWGPHAHSGREVAKRVQVALHLPTTDGTHPPTAPAATASVGYRVGQELQRRDLVHHGHIERRRAAHDDRRHGYADFVRRKGKVARGLFSGAAGLGAAGIFWSVRLGQ
eukprot:scaffold6248_cov121-Isochrysis_galbana.AAC.5